MAARPGVFWRAITVTREAAAYALTSSVRIQWVFRILARYGLRPPEISWLSFACHLSQKIAVRSRSRHLLALPRRNAVPKHTPADTPPASGPKAKLRAPRRASAA